MKKVIALLISAVMLLSVFSLSVFAEDECPHENTSWVQIDFGCACYCDDCGTKLADEQEHDWQIEELQEAECEEPGVGQNVCSRCEARGSIVETEPALGHDYVNGICDRCGAEEQGGYDCSHENTSWVRIDFGCACYCDDCGTKLADEQEHDWQHEETEKAGCTTWGYEHNICIRCGAVEGGMPTSPLGHDYVNGICTRCGEPEVFYTVTSMDKESYDFGDKPTFTFTIRDIDGGTEKLPAWITEGDNFYWMVDFEGPNGESASLPWQMDDYELLTANDTWTFTVTIPGLVFVQYANPGEYKMYLAFWNDLGDSGWVPVTSINYTADITPVEEKLDIDFRLNNDKIGFGFDESLFAWFDARDKSGIHINIPVYYALYYGNEFVLDAQRYSDYNQNLNIVFAEGEDKPGKYTLYATIGDKTYSLDFILGEMPEEPIAENENVSVSGEIKEGTAEIEDIELKNTEEKADIVLDFSSEEDVKSVKLSSAAIDSVSENVKDKFEIQLKNADIVMDSKTVAALAGAESAGGVELIVNELKNDDLTKQQLEAVGKKSVDKILNFDIVADNGNIHEFGGGKVTVSFPFECKDTMDYTVCYLGNDGKIDAMPTRVENGKIVFETSHFSTFVLLSEAKGTNPNTGDSFPTWSIIALCVSIAGMAIILKKRHSFVG